METPANIVNFSVSSEQVDDSAFRIIKLFPILGGAGSAPPLIAQYLRFFIKFFFLEKY